MRIWRRCVTVALLTLAGAGCRTHSSESWREIGPANTAQNPPSVTEPIVVPSQELNGKIARVNDNGRFVVVVFPVGQLPRIDQRLAVFRDGLKVGEIKITGPRLDDSIVADISAGEAQVGDAVTDLR